MRHLLEDPVDASGSPGDATINAHHGSAAIAALTTASVITCSCVTTSSVIVVTKVTSGFAQTIHVSSVTNGAFTVTASGVLGVTPMTFNFLVLT